jgi:hypothetical protein
MFHNLAKIAASGRLGQIDGEHNGARVRQGLLAINGALGVAPTEAEGEAGAGGRQRREAQGLGITKAPGALCKAPNRIASAFCSSL